MREPEKDADLRALIAEVTGRDARDIGVDDDLVRELGLDSLGGLRLLAAIEKRFGVRFPDERLSELRTLRELEHAMGRRGENRDGGSP